MAGFTPWVDNWMHLGGALCGACIAILLLPQYTTRPPSVYQLRSSGDGGAGGRGSSSVAGNGAGGLHGVMCSPLAATSPLRRRNTMTLHLPPVRQTQQTAGVCGSHHSGREPWREARGDREVVDEVWVEMVAADIRTPSGREARRFEHRTRAPADRAKSSAAAVMAAAAVATISPSSLSSTFRARVHRTCRVLGYADLNPPQHVLLATAATCLLAMLSVALSALSSDVQALLRSCESCRAVSCLEAPEWWSCCAASLPGSCTLSHTAPLVLTASCNVSGMPAFEVICNRTVDTVCAAEWDAWNPDSTASTGELCLRFCLDSC